MGDGAFAAAGRADQSRNFPLAGQERDIVQGQRLPLLRLVGEADPVEPDVKIHGSLRLVRHRKRRNGEDFVHPLGALHNLSSCSGHVHQLHNRPGHSRAEDQVEQEGQSEGLLVRRPAAQNNAGRDQEYRYGIQQHHEDDEGIFHGQGIFQGKILVRHNGAVEAPEGKHRLVEGFHHSDSPHILHRRIVHILQMVLVNPQEFRRLLPCKGNSLDEVGQQQGD
ncbi:hypothetical protein D3C75_941180 [compost metagenome]